MVEKDAQRRDQGGGTVKRKREKKQCQKQKRLGKEKGDWRGILYPQKE